MLSCSQLKHFGNGNPLLELREAARQMRVRRHPAGARGWNNLISTNELDLVERFNFGVLATDLKQSVRISYILY